MIKTIQKKGYQIHYIQEDKFKDIVFVMNFCAPLTRKTNTIRSLLGNLLTNSTKKYPTQKTLATYLEELYGASAYTTIMSRGQASVISLKLNIVNESYLPTKENLTKKAIELLHDLIFDQNIDNHQFNEGIVNRTKKEVETYLKANLENKYNYALSKLWQYMGEGKTLSIPSSGQLEDIDKITSKDLYDAYISMLENDEKHLYIIGNLNETDFQLFDQLTFNQTKKQPSIYQFTSTKQEVLEVIESQDIVQAKLTMGFTINTNFISEKHVAMTIYNYILGGYSQSRLFLNVREKNSLAYTINSNYDPYNGILTIYSGIDDTNYEAAKKIILEEIESLKQGCQEEELYLAKKMIVNSIKKSFDSPDYQIALAFNRDITNKQETIDEFIDKIMQVSMEDIKEVANEIKLDTIYLLTGGKQYE